MESSYSTGREINCVIHWYQSWTTYQKQKFLNNLVEKALPNKVDLLLTALGGMNVNHDQPPSIYECQIRLFDQWFEKWSIDARNLMIEKLESFDPTFVATFHQMVSRSSSIS